MRYRLAFLPSTIGLWVVTHLAQTHGLDWSWHWFDVYLFMSWLVFAPMCMGLLTQLKHEADKTVKARRNLYQQMAHNNQLYQDFVNGFATGPSLWFESGSLDQVMQSVGYFALKLLVQLLSPLLVVGLLLLVKPAN
ncbi:hypothetical protein [Lacticaseibacillus sp. N501-2]|uniref:hypothetical protein n=1 Tax=Lacticaseibacillus salsurae TaxID=3367729 RepID=UPI0038B36AF4